jgi:hypothetical protein
VPGLHGPNTEQNDDNIKKLERTILAPRSSKATKKEGKTKNKAAVEAEEEEDEEEEDEEVSGGEEVEEESEDGEESDRGEESDEGEEEDEAEFPHYDPKSVTQRGKTQDNVPKTRSQTKRVNSLATTIRWTGVTGSSKRRREESPGDDATRKTKRRRETEKKAAERIVKNLKSASKKIDNAVNALQAWLMASSDESD